MEPEIAEVISGNGWAIPVTVIVTGVGAIFGMVKKMYGDMRKDRNYQLMQAQRREEKLYKYLEDKNETDLQVVSTLKDISNRLCDLERNFENE